MSLEGRQFPGEHDVLHREMGIASQPGGSLLQFRLQRYNARLTKIEDRFNRLAVPDTVGFLMPFYFGPGPKLTGSTVSRILLGASLASYSNNAKWDALAGLFYWAGTEPSMRQMYPAMWQKPCQNFIVPRYLALCTHINSNPRFWAALTACQQTRNPVKNVFRHVNFLYSSSLAFKPSMNRHVLFNETGTSYNRSCLSEQESQTF